MQKSKLSPLFFPTFTIFSLDLSSLGLDHDRNDKAALLAILVQQLPLDVVGPLQKKKKLVIKFQLSTLEAQNTHSRERLQDGQLVRVGLLLAGGDRTSGELARLLVHPDEGQIGGRGGPPGLRLGLLGRPLGRVVELDRGVLALDHGARLLLGRFRARADADLVDGAFHWGEEEGGTVNDMSDILRINTHWFRGRCQSRPLPHRRWPPAGQPTRSRTVAFLLLLFFGRKRKIFLHARSTSL